MTNEEAIARIKIHKSVHKMNEPRAIHISEALEMAIKALKQEPYEKFENVKDHIYKLASDYKCWDNRLTDDEAIELCHILEQEDILGKIRAEILEMRSKQNVGVLECLDIIDKYRTDRSDEE